MLFRKYSYQYHKHYLFQRDNFTGVDAGTDPEHRSAVLRHIILYWYILIINAVFIVYFMINRSIL